MTSLFCPTIGNWVKPWKNFEAVGQQGFRLARKGVRPSFSTAGTALGQAGSHGKFFVRCVTIIWGLNQRQLQDA